MMSHYKMPLTEQEDLLNWYHQLRDARRDMEATWNECYRYGQSFQAVRSSFPGPSRKIHDATAMDAVETLAAHIMAELSPAWSSWFRFVPGRKVAQDQRAELTIELDNYQKFITALLENSNFYTELHQSYIDAIIGGTACLLIEHGGLDDASELCFRALPLSSLYLDEDHTGRIATLMWRQTISAQAWNRHYRDKNLNVKETLSESESKGNQELLHIFHRPEGGSEYVCDTLHLSGSEKISHINRVVHKNCPFVAFRWLKVPGQVYGASPLMKVLPDIQTANNVVELSLKNASIAVAGIWQAEDDGVINPATLQLKPGAIIPKAAGSAGLTPLASAGRFDLSQILLDQLRQSIRQGMLVDRITAPVSQHQTATEVLTRANETARVLGATYARLFSECLSPLLRCISSYLADRGRGPHLPLDGSTVSVSFLSPLHQAHQGRAAQPLLQFIDILSAASPALLETHDLGAIANWLSRQLNLPDDLRQVLMIEDDSTPL